MLASYAHLFAATNNWPSARAFSNRIRDVSQQLAATGIKKGAAIGSGKVTYDASCHLINGQHAGDAPLQMLQAIADLEFVPLAGSDRCCGGAGVYNLMEPELSARVLDEKLDRIRETGATSAGHRESRLSHADRRGSNARVAFFARLSSGGAAR